MLTSVFGVLPNRTLIAVGLALYAAHDLIQNSQDYPLNNNAVPAILSDSNQRNKIG